MTYPISQYTDYQVDSKGKKVSDQVKRLIQVREHFGEGQSEFAKRINMQQGNYSNVENGNRPLGALKSKDIISILNLNPEWFNLGKGSMFQVEQDDSKAKSVGDSHIWDPAEFFEKLPERNKRLYVPFYEVEITAGKFELFMDIEEQPNGYIYAPEFSGCVSCRVKGDSMYDRIYPGATAFIYYISNKKYIDYGQIYLVILEGYRVLKYVLPHSDPSKVILVSQNKSYPDWEVEKEDIMHLFLVKGYWNQTAN